MKTFKTLFIVVLIAITALSTFPAYADRGHEGHWSGGCWGCGALILGAVIATDIAITQAQQPVYVAPSPVYVQPAPQSVYVSAPVQPQMQSWYYCKSVNGYYPYVTICPEGWLAVPMQPPR